ncbi:MAG: LysM peptidoglycan-binding domain-containing protein [Planctomycetia bacterium]|nr:LysM peptidoglycan-binding domain-containing protein [Planctomycetia bacterium]
MKWFKTLVLSAVVAVIAYGVYTTLTKRPDRSPSARSSAPPYQDKSRSDPVTIGQGPGLMDTGEPAQLTEVEKPAVPGELHAREGVASVESPLPSDVKSGVIPVDPLGHVAQTSGVQPADRAESERRFQDTMTRVRAMLLSGQFAKAQMELSAWYSHRHELSDESRSQLVGLLDELTGTVIYSREHHLMSAHVVKANETLEQIADRCAVPPRLLAKINGITDAAALKEGNELKLVPGPFHAEIDVAQRQITLYLTDHRYAGRCMIGVGQEVPVATGDYLVTGKMEKPSYRGADGSVFEPGDPKNPLGQLLIEVGPSMAEPKFALHGTHDDTTVGRDCVEGCIRLNARDIDDLYDMLLVERSSVKIRK